MQDIEDGPMGRGQDHNHKHSILIQVSTARQAGCGRWEVLTAKKDSGIQRIMGAN